MMNAIAHDEMTLRRLHAMLRNVEIDERSLRPYLEVDERHSRAFAPALRLGEGAVDTEGLEGELLIGFFNDVSRRRRQHRYRRKIAEGWSGLRIVSEGDSWFQFPILLDDVIDRLSRDYAVYSLGAAGDTLVSMVTDDEITAAVEREKPDLFLMSAGGNDLVGAGRLATMLHPYAEGRRYEEYPNANFEAFLTKAAELYRETLEKLLKQFPRLKILFHGYDWAVPANGPWLGKPMARIGIQKRSLQRDILRVMIDRFNETLQQVAAPFEGAVFHVDCRGAVSPGRWFDELHPTDEGFVSVAARFSGAIEKASRRPEVFTGLSARLSPGREASVAGASDLPADDFRLLVTRRARELLDREIPFPETEPERRALESEISRFFEKIHRGADFLPARFLADGARREAAVCRIVTPQSLGSGFLVASADFIMTNNHVLESADVARRSVAEFGFEDESDATRVTLEPDRFFVTDPELDFTIVACDGARLDGVEAIALLRNPATVTREERVNIIQHPAGRPKEISIHDNRVTRVKDKVLHYRTDTEPGSSGSPVFNNDWDLVALHHAGWREADGSATNEGIRIAAIVARLIERRRAGELRSEALDRLLELIPDRSPLLGFFDVAGVAAQDSLEVEVPHFAGTPDFADLGFWNVEHFNGTVDDSRVDRVASVLSTLSMDVMGLVEVERPAMERLVAAMRARGDDVDFALVDAPLRQDLAVLFDRDTSRVELAEDIAERHREALSVTTPSGRPAFPRPPLFARCRVEAGNARRVEFLMIVVHLKAFGDAQSRARRKLAAKVLSEIAEDVRERSSLPVVLGGDFNETLNTDVLSQLTGSPDLFTLTSDDALSGAVSFVGGRHRSLIDHVIVSRDVRPGVIAGDDAAIVRLDRSVRDFAAGVSDHVPIVFRLVGRDAPIDLGGTIDLDERRHILVPEDAERLVLQFH